MYSEEKKTGKSKKTKQIHIDDNPSSYKNSGDPKNAFSVYVRMKKNFFPKFSKKIYDFLKFCRHRKIQLHVWT